MDENVEPTLLVVVGPTATGKSALASQLAERLNGEIISADSVQVYRYFDIGAGKPTAEERARAQHHLIDIAEPEEPLEASVWAELARAAISEVRERGCVPIVCGGTFLWIRALLYGLAEAPPADEGIRRRHKEKAEKQGRESLHRDLALVDPKSAGRLHPNDLVRVSRALEVYELSGRTLSDIQEEHGFRKQLYRAHLLGVRWEKEAYEARLAGRVRAMIAAGFRDEVKSLLARGYGATRAMESVGYRQVKEAVESGEEPNDDELALSVTRVTRIFARRQRTWLRDQPVEYVESGVLAEEEELSSYAASLRQKLGLLQT
jgi:tRNA dimethylallyltransferase